MVHHHHDDFHNPEKRNGSIPKRATCNLVVTSRRVTLCTASELSRREDVASDELPALKLLYSRLCPDCWPWARVPEFIANLERDYR